MGVFLFFLTWRPPKVVTEVWLSFLNSASTTLWYVHQNKVSCMQASECTPQTGCVQPLKELLVNGLFSLHGISLSRSVHPPVGSSVGSEQDLSSPVVGGEETGVQLHSDNLQHLLLIPLTFSLDAVPATCLLLAGAAAASASAGRRCTCVPA